MAHLYHSGCYFSRWGRFLRWLGLRKGMARFRYSQNVTGSDKITHVQAFRCERCGDTLHVDTDWLDTDGGFIGKCLES